MRVIRKSSSQPFQDPFPGSYEFKLCGGCITPEDRIDETNKTIGTKKKEDTKAAKSRKEPKEKGEEKK